MPHKPNRKPPRPCHGPVRGWTHKGLGRVYLEQREVELFGVYPGEEVHLWLGRGRNAWLREVSKPHPDRIEARCPHFGVCGGCSMQSLHYARQLALKCGPLEKSLQRLGAEVLPAMPSPQEFYYRSKVEFSFVGPHLGFHQRGCFDRVVDVQDCLLAPMINRHLLQITRQWQRDHALSGWDVRAHLGDLRYLVLRRSSSSGQWLAVLVTGPHLTRAQLDDWARRLEPLGPAGLIWGMQTSTASAVVVSEQQLLAGQEEIEERLGDLRFRLNWRSFFQSNPPAYQQMLETAREWLSPAPTTVLDLFCGIGTIGLSLTPPHGRLIGVESVPEAIEDARQSALENRFSAQAAEFHCLPAQDWKDLNCDLLILDPPRSGCHPKLIERVTADGPATILYISCNPAKFAEEFAVLGASYRLEKARLFDFFPQTRHVEAMCLLRRLAVTSPEPCY